MALNNSGPISLGGSTTGQSVNLELGQSATAQISFNDAAVRSLTGVASGALVMPTNFWGKSSFTWTSRTQSVGYSSTVSGEIAYINAATPFLIMCGSLSSYTSAAPFAVSYNGTTWTSVNTNLPSGSLYGMAYSGSTYVAATSSGLYSASAISGTWTLRISIPGSGQASKVIWVGSKFVAVGADANGRVIWSSSNGTTWTTVNPPNATVGNTGMTGIAYNGTTYVAVGGCGSPNTSYQLYYSSDAVTWTQVNPGTTSVYIADIPWVVWTGTYFVFPDQEGGVWRSTNGISWSKTGSTQVAGQGYAVANGATIYSPLGFGDSSRYGYVYISTDHGANWTATDTGSNNVMHVAGYGFGMPVTADSSGAVWSGS